VRSAFELPATVKRSVTSAIHGALGREVDVAYEHAAEVVCGVEIRAGGQNLAWSLEGHLDAFARRLAEAVDERVTLR
jgi:F-type H+-transporting ATPase subunit b